MKPFAIAALLLSLPVCADDFAVALDKDGAVSVDGKKLDEAAYADAFKAAADKGKVGAMSDLKLTITCAPELRWEFLSTRLMEAAKAGVWNIWLTVGDKTVEIPLPKDRGLGGPTLPILEEARVSIWTGETGDKSADLRAGKADPDKTAAKTWARLNSGKSIEISSGPDAVKALVELVCRMREDVKSLGKEEPRSILDVAPSVEMRQVFAVLLALTDKGIKDIRFAAPPPK